MSVVTTIILTASLSEEGFEPDYLCHAVDELNDWLMSENYGKFKRVDGYAGGNKAVQAVVFIGAFNYLDMDAFLRAFHKAKWEDADSVRLFVQLEEEQAFSKCVFHTSSKRKGIVL